MGKRETEGSVQRDGIVASASASVLPMNIQG